MTEPTKKPYKKFMLWAGGITGILLLTLVVYALFFVNELTETAKEIHEPMERTISEKREDPITFIDKDPFSVLVLGVDEREGDVGRSDTMIVLAVNHTLQTTKMLSIPRDTRSEIVGKDRVDKLNHAYAFGGIDMSLASVEHFLDIPIDYVVQVNMESFKEIIDVLGGVTVYNPFDFNVDDYSFATGDISLTGDEALTFVRMRKEDPRGDFGRQDRQKQVVQGILQKGASIQGLVKFKRIFSTLGKNIRTNMTVDEMIDVQKNYRDAIKSIEQIPINAGHGLWKDGVWYFEMDTEELQAIQKELQTHLKTE
ncbi:LCP family protein [Sporosarcina oncorhynchi]|uniref:LCP family protein n=1 Tax=Sporosarcina oncorhynchi TaxID=3056444 RepID=A0ABZ0L6Y0_9BACL|nr:LCP family protein [Sporosarcina sp. T2O-4]WOV88260.1 LCP family protein [Sporosarcina sp. T2O-4]